MILSNWAKRATPLSNPSQWLIDVLGGGLTHAGVQVTEEKALGLPTVYACVRILSEVMGQIPLPVYERDGDSRIEMRSHPLWTVLNIRANEEMSACTWKEVSQGHRALWGNSYSVIGRNQRNEVTELLPLMPDLTRARRTDAGRIVYDTVVNGKSWTIDNSEVLHIKGLGSTGLIGWSPIRVAAQQVGVMLAQQEFSGTFYKNGANVLGVLRHPGTVENKEEFRNDWQRYVSSSNANQTAILEQGMEYERIGIPPDEAQFIETQKLNALQIATIFGVPPNRINILDRVTFNNIEHLGIDFVTYTLASWFTRVEQEIDWKLISERRHGQLFVKHNANALMRGDFKGRTEGYGKALGGSSGPGWMSVNEVRALEERNPVPGGDEILMGDVFKDEPAPDEPDDDDEPDEDDDIEQLNGIAEGVIQREARRLMAMVRRGFMFDSGPDGIADHLKDVFGRSADTFVLWLADPGADVVLSEAVIGDRLRADFL